MPLRCTSTASAARLFVQLSTRRSASSSTPSSPILDVLLPSSTRKLHIGRAAPISCARSRVLSHQIRQAKPTNLRPFSSTSSRRKTVSIHNPQKDDQDNEMMLEITPRAANRLSQIMEKDGNPHLALRISVEAGGCHGFQYLMSLTTLPSSLCASHSTNTVPGNPSSPAETNIPSSTTSSAMPSQQGRIEEDDTVLAFVKDDAEGSEHEDGGRALATSPKIVLDEASLSLLKGSKVDFTMELIGSQFKIVDNPFATSSCGCGTSFDIKDL